MTNQIGPQQPSQWGAKELQTEQPNNSSAQSDYVSFQCRDKVIYIPQTSLQGERARGTMLGAMFAGPWRPSTTTAAGHHHIDANAQALSIAADWLAGEDIVHSVTPSQRQGLVQFAQRFGMADLEIHLSASAKPFGPFLTNLKYEKPKEAGQILLKFINSQVVWPFLRKKIAHWSDYAAYQDNVFIKTSLLPKQRTQMRSALLSYRKALLDFYKVMPNPPASHIGLVRSLANLLYKDSREIISLPHLIDALFESSENISLITSLLLLNRFLRNDSSLQTQEEKLKSLIPELIKAYGDEKNQVSLHFKKSTADMQMLPTIFEGSFFLASYQHLLRPQAVDLPKMVALFPKELIQHFTYYSILTISVFPSTPQAALYRDPDLYFPESPSPLMQVVFSNMDSESERLAIIKDFANHELLQELKGFSPSIYFCHASREGQLGVTSAIVTSIFRNQTDVVAFLISQPGLLKAEDEQYYRLGLFGVLGATIQANSPAMTKLLLDNEVYRFSFNQLLNGCTLLDYCRSLPQRDEITRLLRAAGALTSYELF